MAAKKIYPITQATNCLYCGKFFFRLLTDHWKIRNLPMCCEEHRKLHYSEVRRGLRSPKKKEHVKSVSVPVKEGVGWRDTWECSDSN